LPTLLKMP